MATPLPPARPETVDFNRCFRFVFEDPDWVKKVLIGGAFTLASTLIVGIFWVAGYWVRLIRRVVAGERDPLPEWDDLGGIFRDGLQVVGVYFLCMLGVMLVVGAFGCAGGLVVFALGGLAGHDESGAAGALAGMGMAGLYVIFILLSLVLMLYLPAAFTRVALRGQLAEGFNWRANIEFIRANPANYALSLVFYLVASFVAQFGVILCCVGLFPAAFIAYMILGFALGETVRLSGRPV